MTLSRRATTVASPPSDELMTLEKIAQVLVTLGCPPLKSVEMAGQLDKRARQLAAQRQQTYHEAMTHLLGLLKQGSAARQNGLAS